MPIRFMIDTDDLSKLTGHVELLATYADLVTDLPALQAKYPDSEIILINRGLGDPTGMSSVGDIEPLALTIADALSWYDEQSKRGIQFLTLYHDRNDAPAVQEAFTGMPHYTWDATLDGTAHIAGYEPLRGPAVIQCLTADMLGYHADGNLVFEDGWHPTRQRINLPAVRDILRTATGEAEVIFANLHRMAALLGG